MNHNILIGGKWVRSSSGETFESLNPATEKPLGMFQAGTAHDVDLAVDAAQKALPSWSDFPLPGEARSCSEWLTFSGRTRSASPAL